MRVWMLVCIALCITAAPVSAGFLVTEICPDGYAKGDGDEYFVLSGTGSMDGWVITDGEGSVRFPPGSISPGSIVIAREGTAYYTIHGTYPDYEIYSTHPSVPDALFTGRFQMANTKDDIISLITCLCGGLCRSRRHFQRIQDLSCITEIELFHEHIVLLQLFQRITDSSWR